MPAGGDENALPGAAERPHSVGDVAVCAEVEVHVLARLDDVQVPVTRHMLRFSNAKSWKASMIAQGNRKPLTPDTLSPG